MNRRDILLMNFALAAAPLRADRVIE